MNSDRVYTDESGARWLLGDDGKVVRDEHGDRVPAMQSLPVSKPGKFTIYDTSQGHCALCGRLTCNGGCFK